MTAIEQSMETARLRLRPLEMTDVVALNAIQSDPVHMRFYPHPFSLDESRGGSTDARVPRARRVPLLAVEDRETGEFLGNVGLILQRDGVDEVELGWSIARPRPPGSRRRPPSS
jgi:RimJ/RimL family protein N-acetyltransferase